MAFHPNRKAPLEPVRKAYGMERRGNNAAAATAAVPNAAGPAKLSSPVRTHFRISPLLLQTSAAPAPAEPLLAPAPPSPSQPPAASLQRPNEEVASPPQPAAAALVQPATPPSPAPATDDPHPATPGTGKRSLESAFSSPSFADHQTGRKTYQDVASRLADSADAAGERSNPLFEGFGCHSEPDQDIGSSPLNLQASRLYDHQRSPVLARGAAADAGPSLTSHPRPCAAVAVQLRDLMQCNPVFESIDGPIPQLDMTRNELRGVVSQLILPDCARQYEKLQQVEELQGSLHKLLAFLQGDAVHSGDTEGLLPAAGSAGQSTDAQGHGGMEQQLQQTVQRLRVKEQEAETLREEVRRERSMRNRLNLALIGSEATVKKLIGANTPSSVSVPAANSTCKKLLQSPHSTASACSPLDLAAGLGPAGDTPFGMEPPGCMSPKELTPPGSPSASFRPMTGHSHARMAARTPAGRSPALTGHSRADGGCSVPYAKRRSTSVENQLQALFAAARTPQRRSSGPAVLQDVTPVRSGRTPLTPSGPSQGHPAGTVAEQVQHLLATLQKASRHEQADSSMLVDELQRLLSRHLQSQQQQPQLGLALSPVAQQAALAGSLAADTAQQAGQHRTSDVSMAIQEDAPSPLTAVFQLAGSRCRQAGGTEPSQSQCTGAMALAVRDMLKSPQASHAAGTSAAACSAADRRLEQEPGARDSITMEDTGDAIGHPHLSLSLPLFGEPSNGSDSTALASPCADPSTLLSPSDQGKLFSRTLRQRYQERAAPVQPSASPQQQEARHLSVPPSPLLQTVGGSTPEVQLPPLAGGACELDLPASTSPRTALAQIEKWTQGAYIAAKQFLLDDVAPPSDDSVDDAASPAPLSMEGPGISGSEQPAGALPFGINGCGIVVPGAGPSHPWVVAALAARYSGADTVDAATQTDTQPTRSVAVATVAASACSAAAQTSGIFERQVVHVEEAQHEGPGSTPSEVASSIGGSSGKDLPDTLSPARSDQYRPGGAAKSPARGLFTSKTGRTPGMSGRKVADLRTVFEEAAKGEPAGARPHAAKRGLFPQHTIPAPATDAGAADTATPQPGWRPSAGNLSIDGEDPLVAHLLQRNLTINTPVPITADPSGAGAKGLQMLQAARSLLQPGGAWRDDPRGTGAGDVRRSARRGSSGGSRFWGLMPTPRMPKEVEPPARMSESGDSSGAPATTVASGALALHPNGSNLERPSVSTTTMNTKCKPAKATKRGFGLLACARGSEAY